MLLGTRRVGSFFRSAASRTRDERDVAGRPVTEHQDFSFRVWAGGHEVSPLAAQPLATCNTHSMLDCSCAASR